MTTEDVFKEYKKCESMKETARRMGISEGVVRKCLVGYGIIETPLTRRIAELREQGVPQKEMMDILGVSNAWVNANTPYERGMMIEPSQTENAKRIRKCREKKKIENE